MKRNLNVLLVVMLVAMALCLSSCKDKDDEPKLSANHSMLLGKWKFVKSTTSFFYRDPDTGEEVLEDEHVSMNRWDETWDFSNGLVTITSQSVEDPSVYDTDYIWEYRYDEDNDILWMSSAIWRFLKLTPNEMIIYDECKTAWGDNYWASLTNEFTKL